MTNVEPLQTFNLDLPQQQSFVRFYRSLPEKSGVTIRFFNRSDFYTVHGEDAFFAAQNLFGTNTIKYMGDHPKLSYLVLSRANFEKLVRDLLLVKQYRVEVYVKPSASKNQDWTLEYKGSPGNLSQFEEILFENNEVIFNSVVMAVKIVKKTTIAVGCINSIEDQFYISEFTDNELFTELESFIAQISPKECIIPQGESSELVTLKTMLDRNGILVTKVKKTEFNSDDVDQDLNRLLYFLDGQKRDVKVLSEYSFTDAMGCLQAAIKYLNLASDEQNFNQFKISFFDTQQFVRLDSAAINALNLLPRVGISIHNQGEKYQSIFGVLNKCCTSQGKRLLEQWIKQPLRDINRINERLEVVEALVNDSEVRHKLYSDNLTRVPDLLLLAKRLSSKKATLQDCYRVYQTVGNIPAMTAILRGLNNNFVRTMLIDPICDLLMDMEKYQSMVEQTLDLDLVDRGEFFIKFSFDDDLKVLYNQKMAIEEKMQKTLSRAAQELRFDSEKTLKLDCTHQHGYFFRLTLKEEHSIRKNKNFKIIEAVKGGIRFTNDKLAKLNEEYIEIIKNYEEQQTNIVKEILEVAGGYADTLRTLNVYIAKIDVLVSFANVATSSLVPYIRPVLHEGDKRVLKLKKVRHPCLELQDGVMYIPNDVEFKEDENVLYVITGPNMGGKSTYIRSIGVTVLLAHIGSLVPCSEAQVSLVDCILARVGANDSQLKGLSTFMLEMVETSSIIKSATHKSLVLIDELGRGTSTYDGCGIAWAIAENLASQTKCFTLFATHFHELTQLADTIPAVYNLHVTAVTTENTITPLYQIKEGACDKSYGIHCARLVGFPDDVINMALYQQKILEDYEGMKHIKDYEVCLKKKVVEEGDKLLKNALEQIKKLDTDNLSDNELMSSLKKIKEELEQNSNPFVQGLLNKDK